MKAVSPFWPFQFPACLFFLLGQLFAQAVHELAAVNGFRKGSDVFQHNAVQGVIADLMVMRTDLGSQEVIAAN